MDQVIENNDAVWEVADQKQHHDHNDEERQVPVRVGCGWNVDTDFTGFANILGEQSAKHRKHDPW